MGQLLARLLRATAPALLAPAGVAAVVYAVARRPPPGGALLLSAILSLASWDLWRFLRHRKRRPTVAALLGVVASVGVACATWATYRPPEGAAPVIWAVVGALSLPPLLIGLYAPPRIDRALLMAWLLLLSASLCVISVFV